MRYVLLALLLTAGTAQAADKCVLLGKIAKASVVSHQMQMPISEIIHDARKIWSNNPATLSLVKTVIIEAYKLPTTNNPQHEIDAYVNIVETACYEHLN